MIFPFLAIFLKSSFCIIRHLYISRINVEHELMGQEHIKFFRNFNLEIKNFFFKSSAFQNFLIFHVLINKFIVNFNFSAVYCEDLYVEVNFVNKL
jgi:hypothetical protein